MKYMWSKTFMLSKSMWKTILSQLKGKDRFVDLFAWSGAVSAFVAINSSVPVLAIDLQDYSVALSLSIIGRTSVIEDAELEKWIRSSEKMLSSLGGLPKQEQFDKENIASLVLEARSFCEQNATEELPLFSMYGGHYFSPRQSLVLDVLRKTLPGSWEARHLFLASLISAASKCAASPGHTAQPFQPTIGAGKFLASAWNKDVIEVLRKEFSNMNSVVANVPWSAMSMDAFEAINLLWPNDLVFLDPPYSWVQYSRFYHVLEAIATWSYNEVSGVWRYPEKGLRPQSKWSNRWQSMGILEETLRWISESWASAIFTFPKHECSNGLSWEKIVDLAKKYFKVRKTVISRKASTLGGNNTNRMHQTDTDEYVIVLHPRITAGNNRQ